MERAVKTVARRRRTRVGTRDEQGVRRRGCADRRCGRMPSFIPHAGSYGRVGRVAGIGIWTPDMVQKFALELGGVLTHDFKGE
ncbi:MAG: hypothetical protein ACJ8G1_16635 [Vitreoscilla sp.]